MITNARLKTVVRRWWRLLIIFVTPIVLLPLPLIIQTIVSMRL